MRRIFPLLLSLLLALAACGQVAQTEQPTVTVAAPTLSASSSTPLPLTATPAATNEPPTATLVPATPTRAVPLATYTAELSATVAAALPPTATPDPQNENALFKGIDSVAVAPLVAPAGSSPLWMVASQGWPNFDTQKNFVGVYTRDTSGWKELSRLELDGDHIQTNGVQQVQVEPSNVWLEVASGVGAHSGCYDLLRFDGTTLRKEVEGCNSSPFAGELRDLDGDGVAEVVLNDTDNYVFCYACGERKFSYTVYRWDGTQMSRMTLQPTIGEDQASRLTTLAVAQANLGLWKDAQATISRTLQLGQPSQTEQLYGAIIGMHAQDFATQVADGRFPLLDQLFYGDYSRSLDVLRAYTPTKLFARPSPIINEMAQGWESSVTAYVTTTTELVIAHQPDSQELIVAPDTLAAAYFLRGWSYTLLDPPDYAAAMADIEQTAKLKPDDHFFADSLTYLRQLIKRK